MLKKLFSRKKDDQTKKPASAPKAELAPEPISLAHWANLVQSTSGKPQNQNLNRLVEKVNAGEFERDAVLTAVSGLPGKMLALQFEQTNDALSEDDLLEIVRHGFNANVRKLAAAMVLNESHIAILEKEVKGKDKAVYRIFHEKLDVIAKAQKQNQQIIDKQVAVHDSMLKLAQGSLEPMYEAKVKGLVDQWRALAVSDEHAIEAFSNAQQQAESKIAAHHNEKNAQIEQTQAVELIDSDRQKLIDSLSEKLLERIEQLDFSEAAVLEEQHFLSDIQHQWRESEAIKRASKDESRRFHKISTTYEVGLAKLRAMLEKNGSVEAMVTQLNSSEDSLDQLLHDVDDWLHDVAFVLTSKVPDSIVSLQEAMAKYQKNLADHRKHEIDKVRAIKAQLRRCVHAVEDGHLRRASGLFHGVQEKLEGFDLTHHGGIRKQLDETIAGLEKLRDWQAYAVLPKKEALIKKMGLLTEQSIDPDSRAQAIRDMQDEWKQLSRGLQDRHQDLWETFHDLAQKAYEPCKEFFSEQRHLREVNLDRRKEVVDQLGKYNDIVDWEHPDVKEVDRVLQVARNDWRKYTPVDRSANKPVQEQFDRIHKSMFEQLRKEQNVFKDNKRNIIDQAKALLVIDDVKDATEKAKKLQQDWKSAGIVARKDEQVLWTEFRSVCDQLFERREQQVNAFKADLEVNRERAETILASIEELLSGGELLAQTSVIENLKAQYDELGTLPKSHYQKLTKRYKDISFSFSKAQKLAKAAAADQHWEALIQWVKEARFANLDEATVLQNWQTMKTPDVAKNLVEELSHWLGSPDEVNQAALHEKTIDLEILTETDSPASDSSIRMNLQVQRLSDGIGSTVSTAQINQLVVDWLAVGAVDQAAYGQFEERMKKARENWLS